jgi:hypothetical protein
MMDPLEALDRVIDGSCAMLHVSDRFPPGGIIERHGPVIREALQRLTSQEAQRQRVTGWRCNPFWDPDPMMRLVAERERMHRIATYGWMRDKTATG